jgi:L,D-transpeptidase catalytic domain
MKLVFIPRFIAVLAAATVAVLTLGQAAHADLLIEVDKSAQRMTVTVNGEQLYNWPVSTGGQGYETPSGTFKPFRMEIDHYSEEWDNAPMPYSIFFTQEGHAIHGTNHSSGQVSWGAPAAMNVRLQTQGNGQRKKLHWRRCKRGRATLSRRY